MFLVAANTRQALVGQKEWITTGSSGIQVQFLFSADWDGLAKFAVFRNAEIEESVIPIALPASGLTELPAENCAAEYVDEKVYVGVYGTDGLEHIIIPTIWVSLGVLKEGAAYEGMDPPQPTQDMWAQILAIAQNAGAENAAAAEQSAEEAEASKEAIQDMNVQAETLPDESPLTVTKEVDPETGAVTLVFGLTRGPKGTKGDDGYSPTITITPIQGGHRFTVTDKEHPSGQSFDVMNGAKGDKGYSPAITITTITGGHRFTVTDEDHPTGQSFDVMDGAKGDAGYSPAVTITTITGGHRVTITDEDHPTGQSFDVLDGASDAGQVTFDPTQTYPDGSLGKVVSNELNAISQLEMQSLTEDAKTALINCFSHVAWIDQHGQDYIDALVASFKTVTSISAVFTQGANRIYNNDTLDDLKQYLVVTATYNDASTDVLADADYTLSGVLTAGTSTITVTYKNKTDTFDVVVTAVLYPLENGTHLFTANDRVLTVTNGSHFRYEAPNATASSTLKGAYLNLSTVSENNTSATESSNIRTPSDTLFTFLAGSTAVFEVKNIHLTNKTTSTANNQYNIGFRDPTATEAVLQIGDHYNNTTADITVSKTFNADASITCIYAYFRNQYSSYEADIHLTVDGIRWF